MLEFFKETYLRLVTETDTSVKRALYPHFHIDNRLTGLVGPRGVGKTTLMLQYIKEYLHKRYQVFYFSADLVYFAQTTLLEFVHELYHLEGYKIFFIDEIHHYLNWQQELKNLYDAFPDVKIVFSGSSMLDIIRGSYDLSRRAKLFHLTGLSFREYLLFIAQAKVAPISVDTLLQDSSQLSHDIVRIDRIKGHFKEYLETGYYPFILENQSSYYEKIYHMIEKTIFEDIAKYYNLKTENLHYFKKLLSYLASIPPGELNTHTLAQNIGLSAPTTFHYLSICQDVGLVRFIYPFEGGNAYLRRPQKLFLHNTNLYFALRQYLGETQTSGTLRELFFVQSMQDAGISIFYPKQGDFRTQHHVFEIGGKNKTRRQIKAVSHSAILIKDDILMPSKSVIPLMYWGFLY